MNNEETDFSMASRSMVLMNQYGDTTISWDEDSDGRIIPIIEKKMEEGVTFFVLEKPRLMNLFQGKMRKLRNMDQIGKSRKLVMMDEEFAGLLSEGIVQTDKVMEAQTTTTRVAKTAKEVSQNHTVGVRQMRGG